MKTGRYFSDLSLLVIRCSGSTRAFIRSALSFQTRCRDVDDVHLQGSYQCLLVDIQAQIAQVILEAEVLILERSVLFKHL